ncbi:hypothetical protein ACQ4PT_006719 [Festuca glaucescens]
MDSVGGDHDVDREERRERRGAGWSEEDLEENDRRTARIRELMSQAYGEIEEEEEDKKWEPACTTTMADLHVPAVGETREQDCAVCLEEFVDDGEEKLRMMPCSHSFHERCIFDWLDRDRRCPICRFAIKS